MLIDFIPSNENKLIHRKKKNLMPVQDCDFHETHAGISDLEKIW